MVEVTGGDAQGMIGSKFAQPVRLKSKVRSGILLNCKTTQCGFAAKN